MKRFAVGILLVFGFGALAQEGDKPNLEQYRSVYDRELQKLEEHFNERVATWPEMYARDLMALREKIREAGDLDGYLLVNDEMRRVRDTNTLDDKDLLQTHSAVRSIQSRYLNVTTRLLEDKSEDVTELKELYFRYLRRLQADLTREDRIEEALQVRDEIEAVAESAEITDAEQVLAAKTAREANLETVELETELVETTDLTPEEELAHWLGVRRTYLEKRERFFSAEKTPKLGADLKDARKKWERVRDKCFVQLASIAPGDSSTLRHVKSDYLKAFELYQATRRAIKEQDVPEDALKKARKVLVTKTVRLEDALGLYQPRIGE